jgi:SAM-dependent methyltransferase
LLSIARLGASLRSSSRQKGEMTSEIFWKFFPRSFKESLRDWVRRTSHIGSSELLATLYEPLQLTHQDSTLFYDAKEFVRAGTEAYVGDVPVPGWSLRKGYGKTPEEFVQGAKTTASLLRTVMKEQNLRLDRNSAVLDWGCATGRVLQEFKDEANSCEFWGTDIDGSAIAWANEYFSPPFHFVTCTIYPHLPFEDRKFSLIYGGSVFTHIRYLEDFWLMELNRILRPGGLIVVTVQDESTIEWFRDNHVGASRIPRNFDLNRLTAHDQVYLAGDSWDGELTFFRAAWLRRSWGRYFDVVDIKPRAEGFQTAVVLAKRTSAGGNTR